MFEIAASGVREGIYEVYPYKGALRVFTIRARRETAVIVFLHGGGWVRGTPLRFEEESLALAQQGISSLSIEYSIRSRDQTTVYDSLRDVLDAAAFVRDWAAGQPVIVAGVSAGGLLAFHLARSPILSPAGVVLISPVLDLSATGFANSATPNGGDETISPLHMAFSSFPPVLVFHGSADRIVPSASSVKFVQDLAERGMRAKIEIAKEVGHNFSKLEPYRKKIARKVASFVLAASNRIAKGQVTLDT